jgi:hypothetical protein
MGQRLRAGSRSGPGFREWRLLGVQNENRALSSQNESMASAMIPIPTVVVGAHGTMRMCCSFTGSVPEARDSNRPSTFAQQSTGATSVQTLPRVRVRHHARDHLGETTFINRQRAGACRANLHFEVNDDAT